VSAREAAREAQARAEKAAKEAQARLLEAEKEDAEGQWGWQVGGGGLAGRGS
jgi:hypothetical protein